MKFELSENETRGTCQDDPPISEGRSIEDDSDEILPQNMSSESIRISASNEKDASRKRQTHSLWPRFSFLMGSKSEEPVASFWSRRRSIAAIGATLLALVIWKAPWKVHTPQITNNPNIIIHATIVINNPHNLFSHLTKLGRGPSLEPKSN
ncbi:hypothetical protein QYM36_019617 [Artemia franciscana]|uniref:Uncharacterized protein n=1 Tax=Artemia franciscana TaxID=6661 RepID=A0AA88KSY8_ARTSF|nr:hypothetical protein QYM36_019617 [Artemia franciscana]